jgi:hypothetical protein
MVLDSLLAGVMLFTSFAMRTPNVQPNSDDYEFSIGLSKDNYYLKRDWERELGSKYIDDILWYQNTLHSFLLVCLRKNKLVSGMSK